MVSLFLSQGPFFANSHRRSAFRSVSRRADPIGSVGRSSVSTPPSSLAKLHGIGCSVSVPLQRNYQAIVLESEWDWSRAQSALLSAFRRSWCKFPLPTIQKSRTRRFVRPEAMFISNPTVSFPKARNRSMSRDGPHSPAAQPFAGLLQRPRILIGSASVPLSFCAVLAARRFSPSRGRSAAVLEFVPDEVYYRRLLISWLLWKRKDQVIARELKHGRRRQRKALLPLRLVGEDAVEDVVPGAAGRGRGGLEFDATYSSRSARCHARTSRGAR